MQKAWSTSKRRDAGFSTVEALLAALVFGVIATGLVGAMVYGRASSASSGDRARANLLAEEGIEATRNIANASYSNLVDGTYGLVKSGGVWTLSGISDNTDSTYSRQVTIASAGTNRKSVTSTVYWSQPGSTLGYTQMTTRITNWEASIKSWANSSFAGTADATGTGNGIKVAVSGNYAYLVRNTTSNNFIVIDISNPSAPSIVRTSTFTGTPTNIAVSGNYAYVTNQTATSGLQIINIATPSSPTLTRTVALTGTAGALGVAVSGNYAYVTRAASTTTNSNEFTVVNITTPASASVAGGYNNNVQMNEVHINGNYAYVATSSLTQQMFVINITTPTSPTLTTTYNAGNLSAALTITGSGNTVYLGSGSLLDAVNVATPSTPARLGTIASVNTINDLTTDGSGYVFIGTVSLLANGQIQIVNATTPNSMTTANTITSSAASSTVYGVAYSPTYDVVVGATAADAQEIVIGAKN